MNIGEFARLCGVSVRTVRYYHRIGLLPPADVDGNSGYRHYDRECLLRMQEILFYRELDFPLRDIARILSCSDEERTRTFAAQRDMLILKKQRTQRLIDALDSALKGEAINMNIFDSSELDTQRRAYAQEARERWGGTEAYRESEEKLAGRTAAQQGEVIAGMDALMEEFARCMAGGAAPGDDSAQQLVERWRDYITQHFYSCTKEILAGLGQMYIADERFCENIDRHGEGTARFMSEAIAIYCG